MKKILRYTLLFVFSLLTVNYYWHNLSWGDTVLNLVLVALILALFEIILKPILKILLLPISILTLGLIRIIINTVGLYLAVSFVKNFHIFDIHNPAFVQNGFSVPQMNFQGFMAYLVTSFSLSIVYNLFNFILKRKAK